MTSAILWSHDSPLKQFVYDLEFPALDKVWSQVQTLGHINSYGMVRGAFPYIQPRGLSPTRRLFQASQPYLVS
ncbi:hypothetical protein B9T07_25905 [Limnospira fusiformis CCALA 023]